MKFTEAREAIASLIADRPNTKHRQGVIDSILWSVATEDGVECANGLIWLFDLFMLDRGSHNFFDCEETGWDYHHNRYPTSIIEPDMFQGQNKRKVNVNV